MGEFSTNDFDGAGEFAGGDGTASFAPSDVSGLIRWYKGSTLGADNSSISPWIDSTGNANAVEGVAPICKTNIVNGKSVARFTGSQWLNLGDLSALTEGEIFVALRINNDPPGAAEQSGLWAFSNGGAATHYPFPDGNIYDSFGSSVRKTVGNPTPSLAAWRIYSVYSAASDWQAFLDGVATGSPDTGNVVAFRSACFVGTNHDGSIFLDGDIGEILVYNSKLSTLERASVISYLKAGFGIA